MSVSTRRLNVGLIGAGRSGRFHFQRLCLRGDLVPVAVVSGGSEELSVADPSGCRVVADDHELLADESIDLVLATSRDPGRIETVRRAIDLGRPVAVSSPLTEQELALVSESEPPARLLVLSECLADADFQVALAEVRRGGLGQPRTLAHSTWGFTGTGSMTTSGEELPASLLERLEQLLLLCDVEPLSVSARLLVGAKEPEGIGIVARFSGGMTANLEYHPSSPVPLATGWVIAGTTGGYRDCELFALTDDEEVYGTPLESGSIDLDRVYDDIVLQWDDASHHGEVLNRADRLVRFISAVRESLSRGTDVEVAS